MNVGEKVKLKSGADATARRARAAALREVKDLNS